MPYNVQLKNNWYVGCEMVYCCAMAWLMSVSIFFALDIEYKDFRVATVGAEPANAHKNLSKFMPTIHSYAKSKTNFGVPRGTRPNKHIDKGLIKPYCWQCFRPGDILNPRCLKGCIGRQGGSTRPLKEVLTTTSTHTGFGQGNRAYSSRKPLLTSVFFSVTESTKAIRRTTEQSIPFATRSFKDGTSLPGRRASSKLHPYSSTSMTEWKKDMTSKPIEALFNQYKINVEFILGSCIGLSILISTFVILGYFCKRRKVYRFQTTFPPQDFMMQ